MSLRKCPKCGHEMMTDIDHAARGEWFCGFCEPSEATPPPTPEKLAELKALIDSWGNSGRPVTVEEARQVLLEAGEDPDNPGPSDLDPWKPKEDKT